MSTPRIVSFAQPAGSAAAGGGRSTASSSAGKMGLLAIILLGINGIIGSGTFLLPQQIYHDAGFALGLAALLAAGIATLFIVFCYADLAGKVTGNGGAWLYCYTAWGRFTGFQVGIFVWFAGLATISTEVAALIRIFRDSVPALKNHWVAVGIGAAVIVLLGAINWFGPKLSQLVNSISSATKIATAAFFVIAGAFALKMANFKPLVPDTIKDFGEGMGAVGTAYGITFYLFAGFSFLTIAGNKMRNPQKNLSKALVIVIVLVTVVYLLIQTVTVGILGSDTAKSATPVATAMQHTLGEWAYYLVIAGTAVAVFGVAFACSFEVPVLAASLANEHKLLPAYMGKTNKHGAPSVAIIVTAVLACGMLTTGSYVFLASCVVCASAVQYVPTILAVLKLKNMPSGDGAFQLKGAARWILSLLALAASSYLFFSLTWKVLVIAAGVFVIGVIIYGLDSTRRSDPTQKVDPGVELHDPVATRAGSAVIDRSAFPDRVLAASAAKAAAPASKTGTSS